jgi:hypothetical protein
MAHTHAKKQNQQEKLQGDALEDATDPTPHQKSATENNRAIPAADNGGHSRSQAAHLGSHPHDHTKPAGDLRHYEQEREPPQEVSRAGKEYRRQ